MQSRLIGFATHVVAVLTPFIFSYFIAQFIDMPIESPATGWMAFCVSGLLLTISAILSRICSNLIMGENARLIYSMDGIDEIRMRHQICMQNSEAVPPIMRQLAEADTKVMSAEPCIIFDRVFWLYGRFWLIFGVFIFVIYPR